MSRGAIPSETSRVSPERRSRMWMRRPASYTTERRVASKNAGTTSSTTSTSCASRTSPFPSGSSTQSAPTPTAPGPQPLPHRQRPRGRAPPHPARRVHGHGVEDDAGHGIVAGGAQVAALVAGQRRAAGLEEREQLTGDDAQAGG